MKKSSILIISLFLFSISLIAYLVMAAPGDSVVIRSPASGTNYSSISAVIFNVSYVNATDITNPVNATFFLNISGTWMRIGNTSLTAGCTISSCSTTITNTTIPDGFYSVNATLANATGFSISVIHAANLSRFIYVDGTKPIVYSQNFTGGVSSNANLSSNVNGLYYINASIVDALIGVQTVFFNITNSTGHQNATLTATREASTNYYSAQLNTSHFPDGMYNITIFANDSVGNLNNSAAIINLRFDDTAPTISFSCSPNPVEKDETITCSCSGSDATSGVNNSYGSNGFLFAANPSTSNTGTNFEVGCSSKDNAGNINSVTTIYSVTSNGGGSSSGSSNPGLSPPTTTSPPSGSSESNAESSKPTTINQGEESGSTSSTSSRGLSEILSQGWIIGLLIAIAALIAIAVVIKKKKN